MSPAVRTDLVFYDYLIPKAMTAIAQTDSETFITCYPPKAATGGFSPELRKSLGAWNDL